MKNYIYFEDWWASEDRKCHANTGRKEVARQAWIAQEQKLKIAVDALERISGYGVPTGYELEIADEALEQIKAR